MTHITWVIWYDSYPLYDISYVILVIYLMEYYWFLSSIDRALSRMLIALWSLQMVMIQLSLFEMSFNGFNRGEKGRFLTNRDKPGRFEGKVGGPKWDEVDGPENFLGSISFSIWDGPLDLRKATSTFRQNTDFNVKPFLPHLHNIRKVLATYFWIHIRRRNEWKSSW